MSHRYDLVLEHVEVTIFRAHEPLLSARSLLPARSGKVVAQRRLVAVARKSDRRAGTITLRIPVLLAIALVFRLSLQLLGMGREMRGRAHRLIILGHLVV